VIPRIFNPRLPSLLRGSALVLLSLGASIRLADFPHNRANAFITFPAILALAGTIDTIRCMRPRWSFYHGGVLLLIYMDLMAICMILFFLLYPYLLWIAASH
jgi:hypothetical protein